jgi:hypothetical protein
MGQNPARWAEPAFLGRGDLEGPDFAGEGATSASIELDIVVVAAGPGGSTLWLRPMAVARDRLGHILAARAGAAAL